MMNTLFWMGVCCCVLFGVCCFEAEYQAIKNYYPRLTRWDYVMLGNRLRITPDGD